jgi:hypothetical protein
MLNRVPKWPAIGPEVTYEICHEFGHCGSDCNAG